LRIVDDFQKRYRVHIYMGEFSAIRWAPDNSACRYLGDLIEIFEARGWDWSYHAFREWDGWSVEHGGDRNDSRRAASPTDRERLLRGWFERNQKPPGR
jgi:endoglucanase